MSSKNERPHEHKGNLLEDKKRHLEEHKRLPEEKKEEAGEKKDRIDVPAVEYEEMKKKAQEVQTCLDRLLRLQAEFDNYKKRAAREAEEFRKYANVDLIRQLLPTMDALGKAIDSVSANKNCDTLLAGIKMVQDEMLKTLMKNGLSPIECVGKQFDPDRHEAMMRFESSEYPANTVVEELQKGYLLSDRVLRPAMVKVTFRSDDSVKTEERKTSGDNTASA
jgi:molecular chaperone GrpE